LAALRGCIGNHEIRSRDHRMRECCVKLHDLGWDVEDHTSLREIRNCNAPRVRFSATLGEVSEVEVALV
jgi:hypothetical protein